MPNSDSASAISTSGQSTLILRTAIRSLLHPEFASCGAYFHQGSEECDRQHSGERRDRRRKRRPDDDLHEQLGTVDAMANDDEDQIEDPLSEKDEESVQGEVVREEHRLEP